VRFPEPSEFSPLSPRDFPPTHSPGEATARQSYHAYDLHFVIFKFYAPLSHFVRLSFTSAFGAEVGRGSKRRETVKLYVVLILALGAIT